MTAPLDELIALFKDFDRKSQRAWQHDGRLDAADQPTQTQIKRVREMLNEADAAKETFLTALSARSAA